MFDVYGRQNLFPFAGAKEHAETKKILAHAYSKSAVTAPQGIAKPLIEKAVKNFLELLEREKEKAQEIFLNLHWFSLDSITDFLYGGTDALRWNEEHRQLLDDIVEPMRKRIKWYAVYLKSYMKWLYSRTGLTGRIIEAMGPLPMKRPAMYTGIRSHALDA